MATERNPNIASGKTNVPFVSGATPSALGSIGEGLETLTKLGVAVYNNDKIESLQEDVMAEQTAALNDYEQAQAEASAAAQKMQNLDPKDFSTLQELQAHMDSLNAAASQGTRSFSELKIRQEKILRDYMRRYPHLRAEFNQAASGVLGYQPLGAEVRAVEAAMQAAASRSSGNLAQFTNQVLSHGESLGISRDKYYSNPRQYWRDYKNATDTDQRVKRLEQMKAELVALDGYHLEQAKPIIAEAMSQATYGLWSVGGSPGGQANAALSVEKLVGEALMEMGMVGEEGPDAIKNAEGTLLSKIGSGKYEILRTRVNGLKERAVQAYYDEFAWSRDSEGNKLRPLMTMKEFRENYAFGIEKAYDFALEYYGNTEAMEMGNELAQAYKNGIVNKMPREIHVIEIMNRLFPPDSSVGIMMRKGWWGDMTTKMLLSVGQQFGLEVGPNPPEREQPAGPQADATRAGRRSPLSTRSTTVPTPAEMGINGDVDYASLDNSYQQVVGAAVEWTKMGVQNNDRDLAEAGAFMPVGYALMVERSESQNATFLESMGFGNRPSKETDEQVIRLVASPEWPKAWELAYGAPPSESTEHMQVVERVIREATNRRWGEETADLLEILNEPENAGHIRSIRARTKGSATPTPGIGGPTVPKNFAVSMMADYVTFSRNAETGSLEFAPNRSTPEAFRPYVEFITQIANRVGSTQSRRMLVQYGQAYANISGANFDQAMRHILFGQRG